MIGFFIYLQRFLNKFNQKNMKQFNTLSAILFSVLILFIFSLSGCKSAEEVSKEKLDERTTAFFTAIEKQDFETAKMYVTPETQKVLDVVIEDTKKYNELNTEKKEVRVEIVDRTVLENTADYKIKLFVGEDVREETIHYVYQNEDWVLEVPQEQISVVRYATFYNSYDNILILHNKKMKINTIQTINPLIEIKYTNKKSYKKSKKKSHKKSKKHKH
jgi:hypothetical protein